MLAATQQQGLHIADQRIAGMDLVDHPAQRDHVGVAQLRGGLGDQFAPIRARQQRTLGIGAGVAQAQPQQEAVQLRVGQREGARQIDRVLRGNHEERLRQCMRHAIQRHLLLGHRFQQRALRTRRSPVDFVGQQHVGEHRAGMELELPRGGVVDGHAQHIGRQQVGGELHALEAQPQAGGHRMGEGGLAQAGQVLDQ